MQLFMRTKLEYDSEESKGKSVRTAREFPSFPHAPSSASSDPVCLGPGNHVGSGVGAVLRTNSLHGSGEVSVRGKWNPV